MPLFFLLLACAPTPSTDAAPSWCPVLEVCSNDGVLYGWSTEVRFESGGLDSGWTSLVGDDGAPGDYRYTPGPETTCSTITYPVPASLPDDLLTTVAVHVWRVSSTYEITADLGRYTGTFLGVGARFCLDDGAIPEPPQADCEPEQER